MKILISNDDGIYSKGIKVLYDSLKKAGHQVFVVAPLREESGTGHGVTLHRPLRIEEVYRDGKFFGFSVDGKPTDCVKLAFWGIYKDIEFDFVVSGINRGENLGTDMLYSGTFSAASEGTLLGMKAIAISLVKPDKNPKYETAGKFIVKYIEELAKVDFPKDSLFNINVPNVDYAQIKGYKYTEQGDRKYEDEFVERFDPQGNKYYWLGGEAVEYEDNPNVDFNVVKENYISITPVSLNLTNYNLLEKMKKEN